MTQMPGIFDCYFAHLLDGYSTVVIAIAVGYMVAALSWGMAKDWRHAWGLMALGCGVILLYVTVFSRPTGQMVKYCLLPFASYSQIENGDGYLLPQVIMNVVVFVPIGFLIKAAFNEWNWGKAIVCGMSLSMTIEALQLILMKGTAELDDVIHNTIGTVIGIAAYEMLRSCMGVFKRCL